MKPAMKYTMQAICLFAAFVAGSILPGFASAHDGGDGTFHVPEAPQNLRVTGLAGGNSNLAVVSWDSGHYHPNTPFAQTGYTLSITAHVPEGETQTAECIETKVITIQNPVCVNICTSILTGVSYRACMQQCSREGSIVRNRCVIHNQISIPNKTNHTEIITGLTPNTTYYVRVTAHYADTQTGDATARVAIFGTDIPNPITPTEPEPPEPGTPTCTYEHRITGAPGTTGGGYTSQILINSKESNATATIRAFQNDNGHPIDVIDSEGEAIGSTTSLAPANSVKVFKLEGAQGWHSISVEHPSSTAMNNATVVMWLREPNGGVSIVPVQGIERCVTAGTNTE